MSTRLEASQVPRNPKLAEFPKKEFCAMTDAGLCIDQVPRIKEHLTKALAGDKEQTAIQLLGTLRTFRASTDTLKSTRIGVFVTELRKHPNATDRIKELSRDLVSKWKSDLGRVAKATPSDATRRHSESHKTYKSAPSTPSVTPTTPGTRAPTSSTATTPNIIRTPATDHITLETTGDKIRDGCIGMMYSSLASNTDEVPSNVAKRASSIEVKVFTECGSTDSKYKSRIRSLACNLKSNVALRSQVLNGNISADTFAVMTAEDMMSKERILEVEKAKKDSMHVAVAAPNQEAETDMFKCGRCGYRKTTYYQMQTRSADEPMVS
ncbi:hypothetical protein BASA50_007348 [Batrachochytrium salamandrivorans]|uniref:Transcription elongation factor S-II n=1 Tax=Batrachochytrium salamandrivorans TaxID=1357716 RepID=A0ABQ8F759_9FUNG|nr:hypothetical protein BASA60_010387 [Batrachochytrium salamandrivorans]KAH6578682.1 hypothetical protein BASA61_000147 [Batrachochytrium salamandrivorans]KAH6593396.1 hypothetical protein BASA50_007348 [Batrachochytrium salamandrivorans]